MNAELTTLRRLARAARRDLEPDRRRFADHRICVAGIDLLVSRRATTVSSYLSTDGEPDLTELHRWCAAEGVTVVVPVMGPEGSLRFRELGAAELVVNSSGIPEPPDAAAEVALQACDVVFCPLVIFDGDGNRAGRGGGWYDRALGARHDRQLVAGVAYELQRVERVPTHAGDVPLDLVITEQTVHRRS